MTRMGNLWPWPLLKVPGDPRRHQLGRNPPRQPGFSARAQSSVIGNIGCTRNRQHPILPPEKSDPPNEPPSAAGVQMEVLAGNPLSNPKLRYRKLWQYKERPKPYVFDTNSDTFNGPRSSVGDLMPYWGVKVCLSQNTSSNLGSSLYTSHLENWGKNPPGDDGRRDSERARAYCYIYYQ
jgi:hypothetical protein